VRYSKGMSATDLLAMQPTHLRSELVNGRMIVRDPGAYEHGKLSLTVGSALLTWVTARGLGDVVGAETGFTLRRNPDTVRAPDAAFISNARVPHTGVTGFAELAPDLVVEIASPSDRAGEVSEKVADWLNAGVRLVWAVDAERRRAVVHRENGTTSRLTDADSLDGEAVLPGFTLPLRSVFGA
jgi:Uma2 family endonuclease